MLFIRLKNYLFPTIVGIVVTSLPFYRVLFYSDRALLFRDLARDYLAEKAVWANSVRSGSGIPYWNHFTFGGSPFYAQNACFPLHPLNSIFLLFSPANYPYALNLFIWIHYFLFFLGIVFLLRVYRFRNLESILFASLITISGTILSLHNLVHILASVMIAPYFLALWRLYLKRKKFLFLFLASFCLGWPIYGGDPQVTYILSFIALLSCLRMATLDRKWKFHFLNYLTLGILSLLSCAAQLLPSLEFASRSIRGISALNTNEILYFSFHPARILETIYPVFFGNRYGSEKFWGEDFVNFTYKTPFVFSTYPGSLVLLLFFLFFAFTILRTQKYNFKPLKKLGILFLVFLLCFGDFSIVPFYEWALSIFPFFSSFRYPERLLFWAFFYFWWISAFHFKLLFRFLQIFPSKKNLSWNHWKYLALPTIFLITSFIFFIVLKVQIYKLPISAITGITFTLLFFGIYYSLFLIPFFKKPNLLLLMLFALTFLELFLLSRKLIWDQSANITNQYRYPILQEIFQDMENRKKEISLGGSRRISSITLAKFYFLPERMDHTTSTSFSAFDSLVPNVASYFGLEDISGYYAFTDEGKKILWERYKHTSPKTIIEEFHLIASLSGAYYLPMRDEFQIASVVKNKDALPYLFIPEMVSFAVTPMEATDKLLSPGFPYQSHAVLVNNPLYPQSGTLQQKPYRLQFPIQKRDGKHFEFNFTPAESVAPSFLIWNESFDPYWKARVDEKELPIFLANIWAMAIQLPAVEKNHTILIKFSYENPWIQIGQLLSSLWLLVGAIYLFLVTHSRKRNA